MLNLYLFHWNSQYKVNRNVGVGEKKPLMAKSPMCTKFLKKKKSSGQLSNTERVKRPQKTTEVHNDRIIMKTALKHLDKPRTNWGR